MDINKLFDDADSGKNQWKSKKYEPQLIPVLKEEIIKYNKERKSQSETLFRASGIGECTRKWAYKYSGLEDPMDVKGMMTVNVGTAYHELIQEYLKDKLISLEEQVYFSDLLGGHYDGEISAEITGDENAMLEIKTTSADNFQRMIKHRVISNKYKMQANVYMEAKGWNKALFVFVNRNLAWTDDFLEKEPELAAENDPIFLEIVYHKDPEFVKKIHDEIELRNKFIEDGIMPPFIKELTECKYCSFKPKCKEDRKAEKKLAKEKEKSQNKKRED